MTTERDLQKTKAAQVGFILRAYRESFLNEDGRRGLTQEELLRRMGEVDSTYAKRYSHATVSRWESGITRPTVRRLRIIGSTLGLSEVEVSGLIAISGLDQGVDPGPERDDVETTDDLESWDVDLAATERYEVGWSLATESIRFLLFRCLPLGICIAGAGHGFGLLGYDSAWMPVAYVAVAIALVLGQGFFLADAKAGLREFFWVTVFLVLTTPLLQFAPLRMDHYGLYALGNFYGTHMPYMLALLANLALASSAGLAFQLLWTWQNTGERASGSAHTRAAKTVLPPLGVVYAVILVFSNVSIWIQFAVLLPVVAAVFTVLLILRDPSIRPSESDRRMVLVVVLTLAMVSAVLGIITVLSIFLSPHLPAVLPDHSLIRSWELDFEQLGYSRQEAHEMLNLGYLWHAICVFIYLVFVVGTHFVLAIYQMGERERQPAQSFAPTGMPAANRQETAGSQSAC